MGDVVVRGARAADCEDLYEVNACPGVVWGTLQLPYVSMDVIRKRLEEPTPDTYTLVAEVEGRAIHLYKNFGFEIEGTRRALSFRDGEYVDTYAMTRLKD